MMRLGKKVKLIIALIVIAESTLVVSVPPAIAVGNPVVRFTSLLILVVALCYILLLLSTWKQGIIEGKKTWKPRRDEEENTKPDRFKEKKERPSLAMQLVKKLTLGGRLLPYLPVFGIAVIVLDLWYNGAYNNWSMGETDTTTILFGAMLIVYRFVPKRFSWERDFVMLFSVVLVLILVIPLMITRALKGDPDANVNMYSRVILGPSLTFVLNLIGISSSEGTPPPGGSPEYPWIYYMNIDGVEQHVGISASCAGLYSFTIFVGLFSAYVLVQYSRLNLKIGLLLLLGFFTSYLANIFRMTIIVMAGYYYGMDPLVWLTHEYAGLLIFMLWLGVFWFFLIKYMAAKQDTEDSNITNDSYTDDDVERTDYYNKLDEDDTNNNDPNISKVSRNDDRTTDEKNRKKE